MTFLKGLPSSNGGSDNRVNPSL